ncbi:MAG: aminotransferase class I/II-fold pyridoxal phosphate-dependent enzyme [Oscillospiraceae bacterium]|nr:aminotransferase class I/II-fold pyridoxal phosphate-dependent enzyme [Oscillospiraceae bacterium]
MEVATYACRSREELRIEAKKMISRYGELLQENLKLDMSRGKPSTLQLDLVSDMLNVLNEAEDCKVNGADSRNYGELAGLPCAREYWADVLGCKASQTFVGGNASLSLMHDLIARAYTHGLKDSPRPWCREERVKFLCPSPGYDRHFRITEHFGFELITVPMHPEGPDMDVIEELVKDPAVKGVWCVPKYSNPQGYTYSDETIDRFANLKPAAPDFVIMWDNAYCVHEFDGEFEPFRDIISLCAEAGRPNMVYEFASTSKITFPGAGMSVMASSEENIAYNLKLISVQTISYDKVNQLRHVRYLKDKAHTLELMKKHAEILGPKFDMVLKMLRSELTNKGIAHWHHPKGGYFVCVAAMPGTAKRTLELCSKAGVVMTEAGATYPYGHDPHDSMIRIAPSLPPIEELEKAMKVFCTCLKIAALEKYLGLEIIE